MGAVGGLDPFVKVRDAVSEELVKPLNAKGKDFAFYPIVGNHDLYNTTQVPELCTENPADTQTRLIIDHNKKNLPHIVNWGPEVDSQLIGYEDKGAHYTTYSFDYGNSHFAVIDLYYANSKPGRGNGNFSKATAKWLEEDLAKNKKDIVFVFGHEPVIPYTTPDGKEVGSKSDLIDNNADALWEILKKHKVDAYFCGHSHLFGTAVKDGITQINAGICGVESGNSYVMVFIDDQKLSYKAHVNQHTKGKGYAWAEFSGAIEQ